MKRSAFEKWDDACQNKARENRALRLRDDFLKVAQGVGWGEYETWVVKLHLAFLDFCRDIEDCLAPEEYGTPSEGPFKDMVDRVQQQYPPDPEWKGVVIRRTGPPKTMNPDGSPNVEAIRELRKKYPRVWWMWDLAERTGHVQIIPRPCLWQRGGAAIPDESKMAILVYPDTTKDDVLRGWQSAMRLKAEAYRGETYPRSQIPKRFEWNGDPPKWPDIVRACEEIRGRGKYATVGRRFRLKADTVKVRYEKARCFVFCGPSVAYRENDRADGTDEIEEVIRPVKSRGVHRDPRPTARKPRLTSYVNMTPEERKANREHEKTVKALLKKPNRKK